MLQDNENLTESVWKIYSKYTCMKNGINVMLENVTGTTRFRKMVKFRTTCRTGKTA